LAIHNGEGQHEDDDESVTDQGPLAIHNQQVVHRAALLSVTDQGPLAIHNNPPVAAVFEAV